VRYGRCLEMLTKRAVEDQIKRLSRLPFMPVEQEDRAGLVKEWKRAIELGCSADRHVVAVVDYLIDHLSKVPAPAEIVAACREIAAPDRLKAPLGCEICQGSGYKHFERRVEPAGVAAYRADVSDYCDCSRGVWMRQCADARREEDRQKAARKAGLA